MGIIPTPSEYGVNCAACWPAGETPKYLKVFFSGIKMGDLWLPEYGSPQNGYFDVKQVSGSPCDWYGDTSSYTRVWYEVTADTSYLKMKTPGTESQFLKTYDEGCVKSFVNSIQDPKWAHFCGGTAYVCEPMTLAAVIASVTPLADPDPRMECFPMDLPHVAIRYAGKKDATNIVIEFDPTA